MKNLFKNQDPIFQTVLYSIISCVVISLCLIPLYLNNMMYIPNGIIIGFAINILAYLATYLIKHVEERTKTVRYSIIVTISRFFLLAAALIVFALLEFRFQIKIANFVAIVGGYFISLLIYVICVILEGKRNAKRKIC